jgi:hypothetical protein
MLMTFADDAAFVRIDQNFDPSAAAQLQVEIALAPQVEVALDFTSVTSFSDISLAMLRDILRNDHRHRLRLVGLGRNQDRLLGLLGIQVDERGQMLDG